MSMTVYGFASIEGYGHSGNIRIIFDKNEGSLK